MSPWNVSIKPKTNCYCLLLYLTLFVKFFLMNAKWWCLSPFSFPFYTSWSNNYQYASPLCFPKIMILRRRGPWVYLVHLLYFANEETQTEIIWLDWCHFSTYCIAETEEKSNHVSTFTWQKVNAKNIFVTLNSFPVLFLRWVALCCILIIVMTWPRSHG